MSFKIFDSENNLSKFDYLLLLNLLALLVISVLAIYSANVNGDGVSQSNQWFRQILWIIASVMVFVFFCFFDYHKLLNFTVIIFLTTIILLIIVQIMGHTVAGAMRWLNFGFASLQPSELGKASTIIILAAFFADRKEGARKLKDLFLGLLLISPLVLLVLLQPDLGTALAYLAIYAGIVFAAGANLSLILFLILTIILTITYLLITVWNSFLATNTFWLAEVLSTPTLLTQLLLSWLAVVIVAAISFIVTKRLVFYLLGFVALANTLALGGSLVALIILKPYQMERLAAFLNPNYDPLRAGYHALQSLTAIGAGGLRGQGYLQGTHTHLQYLPEQSTDFIFSVIGEEFGLVGAAIVLLLYLILLIRLIYYSFHAVDSFGSYLCLGLFTLIFFHLLVNVGMVIGLAPITGIPLFLLSYGGSSLLTIMALLGIASNVYRQRLHAL
jgi:rod shape determining protein RodA